jgi:hypothetical protein
MEPPGSTHIPIRERASSQEETADDDDSFAGDDDSSHSPKSVACTVPEEIGNKSYSTEMSMMGDSCASLASEYDMQDLFVHIEAKEKEKKDLEESVQQLDKRLSMVQETFEAASQKLTRLRGGQDSNDVKEGKDVKEICTSSESKEICDSSDSDSDSDSDDDDEYQVTCKAASPKLTMLRGGQDSSDVKEGKEGKEIFPVSVSTEICDSSSDSDSDSDDDDDDDE